MRVASLFLINFRNYAQLDLELDNNLNFFVGNNAQGKTNLLEAIVFLSTGKSYRTKNEKELILWGKDHVTVAGKIVENTGENKIKITYDAKIKKKNYFINSIGKNRISLSAKLTTVLFSPDDLSIVKGAPQNRRSFLDEEICKISPLYEKELYRYQHIVRQRNHLLKTFRKTVIDSDELLSWNQQLAPLAARIVLRRSETVHRLGLLARLAQRRLTGRAESLELIYNTTLPVKEASSEKGLALAFLEQLQEKKEQEARFGQTIIGPHRDDLVFLLNGYDARLFASQGQQRTLVLALKLAEMEFIKGETGKFPVLLFDDVFSELDERRRAQLIEAVDGRAQLLVTGTELDRMGKSRQSGHVFSVSAGEVKKIAMGFRNC